MFVIYRKSTIARIEEKMSSINKDNEECIDAMLFRNSNLFPMVFKAAIELDLFSIIAKAGPGAHISAAKVASQLPTNNPSASSMLDRVLRFLASHSVLAYSLRTLEDGRTEKLYGLTPPLNFSSATMMKMNPSGLIFWPFRTTQLCSKSGNLITANVFRNNFCSRFCY